MYILTIKHMTVICNYILPIFSFYTDQTAWKSTKTRTILTADLFLSSVRKSGSVMILSWRHHWEYSLIRAFCASVRGFLPLPDPFLFFIIGYNVVNKSHPKIDCVVCMLSFIYNCTANAFFKWPPPLPRPARHFQPVGRTHVTLQIFPFFPTEITSYSSLQRT